MSAYAIFIRDKTIDQAEMDAYSAQVGATLQGHSVEILAAYGPHVVLEGGDVEGVLVAKFPSLEAARAWYDSPAYQEVVKHRFKGAAYRAVIVEGLPVAPAS